jgi:hypothetical protein
MVAVVNMAMNLKFHKVLSRRSSGVIWGFWNRHWIYWTHRLQFLITIQ